MQKRHFNTLISHLKIYIKSKKNTNSVQKQSERVLVDNGIISLLAHSNANEKKTKQIPIDSFGGH